MFRFDNSTEDIFKVISRCKKQEGSKAAAVIDNGYSTGHTTTCQMIVANNPNRIKSKAASVVEDNKINKVKEIHDFIISNGKI